MYAKTEILETMAVPNRKQLTNRLAMYTNVRLWNCVPTLEPARRRAVAENKRAKINAKTEHLETSAVLKTKNKAKNLAMIRNVRLWKSVPFLETARRRAVAENKRAKINAKTENLETSAVLKTKNK